MTGIVEPTGVPEPSGDDPPSPAAGLAEAVRCALTRTGRSGFLGLVVEAVGCEVILGGTVSSYFLKQMALATAMRVPGVESVRNDIQVRDGDR